MRQKEPNASNLEIREMERMMKQLRKGAESLLVEVNPAKTLSHQQKRELSKSSWAKSTTKKLCRFSKTPEGSVGNLNNEEWRRAEAHVKTNPPSVKFSTAFDEKKKLTTTAKPSISNEGSGTVPTAVKFESSSTFTKAPSISFGKSRRDVTETIQMKITDKEPNAESAPTTKKENNCKGVKFGTEPRFTVPDDYDEQSEPERVLNIETSDKLRYLRPSGPIMRPDRKWNDEDIENSEYLSPPRDLKIEYLSHVINPPIHRIHTPISKPPQYKVKLLEKAKSAEIGPGKYDIVDSMASNMLNKHSGKIYHEPSDISIAASVRRKVDNLQSQKSNIDSDSFHILECDKKLRTRSPSVMLSPPSDGKDTSKHLRRKKYFEDKANDARNFHDNQIIPSDTVLSNRSKSPSVIMRSETQSVLQNDEKLKRIHNMRQTDQMDKDSIYDIKYNFIEKNPTVMVSMAAEMKSKESLQTMLSQKPRIKEIINERNENRDILYGPQLPVQWAPETNEPSRPQNPTKDVQMIFENRRLQSHTIPESETSSAYLKSSFSGNLSFKATVIMKEESTRVGNVVDEPIAGPLLGPVDWLENMNNSRNKYKNMSLRMNSSRGRENIRIYSKGVKETISFNDVRNGAKVDDQEYQDRIIYSSRDTFGDDAKGYIDFNKMTSRKGNEPSLDMEDIRQVFNEEFQNYESNKILDLEPVRGKDYIQNNRTPNIQLYTKDRFPSSNAYKITGPVAINYAGGNWFKGMAEEIESKSGIVDYNKMSGRDTISKDQDIEMELISRGDMLDLEPYQSDFDKSIKSNYLKFADPDKHQRFDGNDANDDNKEYLDIAPNVDFVKISKSSNVINMNKMKGRELLSVDYDIESDVHGTEMINIANIERLSGINSAKDNLLSDTKKSKFYVNMKQQRGRCDDDSDITDEHRMTNDISSDPNDVFKPTVKHVLEWSKQPEYDDIRYMNENIRNKEEIIVDTSNKEVLSRFKKTNTGVAWRSCSTENSYVGLEVPLAAPDAIYEDIDPGKFKKGLGPLLDSKKVIDIANTVGRDDVNKILEEELFQKEKVLINPNIDNVKKKPQSFRIQPSATIPPEAISEFETEQLDLTECRYPITQSKGFRIQSPKSFDTPSDVDTETALDISPAWEVIRQKSKPAIIQPPSISATSDISQDGEILDLYPIGNKMNHVKSTVNMSRDSMKPSVLIDDVILLGAEEGNHLILQPTFPSKKITNASFNKREKSGFEQYDTINEPPYFIDSTKNIIEDGAGKRPVNRSRILNYRRMESQKHSDKIMSVKDNLSVKKDPKPIQSVAKEQNTRIPIERARNTKNPVRSMEKKSNIVVHTKEKKAETNQQHKESNKIQLGHQQTQLSKHGDFESNHSQGGRSDDEIDSYSMGELSPPTLQSPSFAGIEPTQKL